MDRLRRQKLRDLLATRYGGERRRFLEDSGISKGRLSQLLSGKHPFGEEAARNLEDKLRLEPGYFDSMDARTVAFALQFEALPPELKERWEELTSLLGRRDKP
jgi:transcriptional regulator with XRE-family HTH domain